ncbi:hypothetical protein D3C71_1099460 [compost metagenome]
MIRLRQVILNICFRIQTEEKFEVITDRLVRHSVQSNAVVHVFLPVDCNLPDPVYLGMNDHKQDSKQQFDPPANQQIRARQSVCFESPDKPG